MVVNVHERMIDAPGSAVGNLLDGLGSSNDRLWPSKHWPAIRFDGALEVGAKGAHGPIHYFVEKYEPGHSITFRFTRPTGFDGTHSFVIERVANRAVRLRHELRMRTRGFARLTWPLAFRWLHDALIEDAFDRAEDTLRGVAIRKQSWSWQVRLLRSLFKKRSVRRIARGTQFNKEAV